MAGKKFDRLIIRWVFINPFNQKAWIKMNVNANNGKITGTDSPNGLSHLKIA